MLTREQPKQMRQVLEMPLQAWRARLPILLAIGASICVGIITLTGVGLKVDEGWHLAQAQLFARGQWRPLRFSDVLRMRLLTEAYSEGKTISEMTILSKVREIIKHENGGEDEPMLSMLPGYHCVIASVLSASHRVAPFVGGRLPDSIVAGMANWCVAIVLLTLLCRFCKRQAIVGAHTSSEHLGTAATAWTSAVLLPFHWLIYTDVLSTLLVMAMVTAAAEKRPSLAGFLGLLSVCIRQSNVVFVATIPLIDAGVSAFATLERTSFRVWRWDSLRRYWAVGIVIGLFVVFCCVNGRISVGPDEGHTAGISATALTFSAAVFAVCVLPLVIWNMVRVVGDLKKPRSAAIAAACCILATLGAWGFEATHPWNRLAECPWLLRNHVLALLTSPSREAAMASRIGLGLLLIGACMTLATTALRPGFGGFLAIAWCVSVFPFVLLEPRYSMAPIVLWLTCREPAPKSVERCQFAWGIAIGGTLAAIHAWTGYFV